MALEQQKAEMLRGYQFFRHPEQLAVGILRLDTENEQHWLMMTKKSLEELSAACAKHADELPEIQ